MFKNISLSLSGLVFALVIAVVYFKKKKYNSVENNIYRVLIVLTIFLLILEMACNIMITYREDFPLFTEILCRSLLLGGSFWFIFLIAYMEAFLTPEKYKSMKDVFLRPNMIILVVGTIILFIVACFLKITYKSGEFNVIGGPASFSVYVTFFASCVLISRVLSRNADRFTLIRRLPIFLYLVLLCIMKLFQLFYTNLSDLCFLFSFCIVAMYFTIENQDLKLASELEIARKEDEQASKSKTQLLSKMSYDIITPMSVVMGFSESIVNNDLTKEEILDKVNDIHSSGQELLDLLNNILLFSQLDSNNEIVANAEYDISNIASDVYNFVDEKIKKKNLRFKINIEDNTSLKYIGDKNKIYVMLTNLIACSKVYNSINSIVIDIENRLEDNINKLIFKVKYLGSNVSREFVNMVKKQLTNSTIKGTNEVINIEILLVKELCELLKANITIDEDIKSGFRVEIAIEQQAVGNSKTKRISIDDSVKEKEENTYFDCSNYKVLVVDDNQLNLRIINKLLQAYKLRTELLNSGKECVARIKKGEKYDLIFLDHMMPEMDGIETIRMLRKMDVKTPIIAMTANAMSGLEEKYKKEGFNDYISKPISIKNLYNLMTKYFK